MSEEKKNEDAKMENLESNIQISDDVVAVIAGMAASEVPGVADMAGGFAGGISEVLSGKKNMSKGIKVEIQDKNTKIDVNIIVEYGTRIPEVAFEIQKRVKTSVENMTGLTVEEVNVHVQGVSTNADEKKSRKDKKEAENKEDKKEDKVEEKVEVIKKQDKKPAEKPQDKKSEAEKEEKKK